MLLACLCLVGCKRIELVSGLDQREANEIVVKLQERGIQSKISVAGAGEETSWTIGIPSADESMARSVLEEYELPRDKDWSKLMDAVKKNLGTFASEDQKSQVLKSIEEWEASQNVLSIAPNLVSARVALAIPEPDPRAILRGEIVTVRPSASVVVKYMREPGSEPPSKSVIQHVVAGGVENMSPGDVEVALTAVTPSEAPPRKEADLKILFVPIAILMVLLAGVIAILASKNRGLSAELARANEAVEVAEAAAGSSIEGEASGAAANAGLPV